MPPSADSSGVPEFSAGGHYGITETGNLRVGWLWIVPELRAYTRRATPRRPPKPAHIIRPAECNVLPGSRGLKGTHHLHPRSARTAHRVSLRPRARLMRSNHRSRSLMARLPVSLSDPAALMTWTVVESSRRYKECSVPLRLCLSPLNQTPHLIPTKRLLPSCRSPHPSRTGTTSRSSTRTHSRHGLISTRTRPRPRR